MTERAMTERRGLRRIGVAAVGAVAVWTAVPGAPAADQALPPVAPAPVAEITVPQAQVPAADRAVPRAQGAPAPRVGPPLGSPWYWRWPDRQAAPAAPGADAGAAATVTAVATRVAWVRREANVRTRPSREARRVTTLCPGTRVEVEADGAERGWVRVALDGRPLGYMAAFLLTDTAPSGRCIGSTWTRP